LRKKTRLPANGWGGSFQEKVGRKDEGAIAKISKRRVKSSSKGSKGKKGKGNSQKFWSSDARFGGSRRGKGKGGMSNHL